MCKRVWCFVIVFLLPVLPVASYAGETIAAKVNGHALTVQMVEMAADQLIGREVYHGDVSGDDRDKFRGRALEVLINEELMYQDALAKGMKPDPNKVKERMRFIRDQYSSQEEYESQMKREGLTEKRLLASSERYVLINQAIDKMVFAPSQMSEDALKDYYAKNLDKFKEPEKVRVRIFSTKDEKKAKDALGQLQDGKDFGDVAARMSEDDYRIMGGDMGFIHRGRLLQEVEDVAFSLKAGQTSGITKVGEKWVIVKLEARQPERLMTFDESKGKLKKDLEEKRARELREKWIADLHAKAKIEVLWKPLDKSN